MGRYELDIIATSISGHRATLSTPLLQTNTQAFLETLVRHSLVTLAILERLVKLVETLQRSCFKYSLLRFVSVKIYSGGQSLPLYSDQVT